MRRDEVVRLLRQLEDLRGELKALQRLVEDVETALESLSECERDIIGKFYINPEPGVSKKICEMFDIERTTVYRRRDNALLKLGKSLPDLRDFCGALFEKKGCKIKAEKRKA